MTSKQEKNRFKNLPKFPFPFQSWRKWQAYHFRKNDTEVLMKSLVNQILTKVRLIKEVMQKTWVKLEELEDTYQNLRAAKMDLITYGGNCNQNNEITNDKNDVHHLSVSQLRYKYNK